VENKSLEEGLLEYLKYADIDKQKLSDAVKTIVHIANTTETNPMRIFPKGIPGPDGWGWWNWFDNEERMLSYIKNIISRSNISVDVFPLGIPKPDGWLVESTLGAAKSYST
jgi:hypothetical protein